MYSNTEEYRAFVRNLVHMDPSTHFEELEDPDPETADEFHYDESSMSRYLDLVYAQTKENALFQDLYLAAAALMISNDPEIGLAVLFSYDYLATFHFLHQSYLVDPTVFSANNQFYQSLIHRLKK